MCDGRPGPSSAALPLEQAHELGVRDYGAVSVAIFWISQSRFPDQPDRAIPDTDPPQGQRGNDDAGIETFWETMQIKLLNRR